MTDIDERLREYAARWRAAQPAAPVPASSYRGRDRGWLVAAAVAAAVVALLAGAATLVRVTRSDPATPRGAVPWRPLPHDRQVGARLPDDCTAGALAAAAGKWSATVSGVTSELRLTNTGGTPCTVALSGMTLRGPGGAPIGVVGVPEQHIRSRAVPAGETARVRLRWDGPYCGPAPVALETTVGGTTVRAEPSGDGPAPPCAPSGGRPSVLRYFAVTVSGDDDPEPVLTGRLVDVPETVESNATMRYVLVLRNPTDRTVPLAPCPALEQRLDRPGALEGPESVEPLARMVGRLHCEAAPGEIGPGGEVAFEMRLWLAGVPEGEYEILGWTSAFGRGELPRARVTVKGSAPRVSAPCGPGAYVVIPAELEVHPDTSLGSVELYNASDRLCDPVRPMVRVLGPDGEVLAEARPAGTAPVAPIAPGRAMWAKLSWRSHCGRWATGLSYQITFPGSPPLVEPVPSDTPPCRAGVAVPLTLEWGT